MSLAIWTIYQSPSNHATGQFVARKWWVKGEGVPTEEMVEGATLDEVRAKLPPYLFRMARDPSDDACIVESWL
jgi:hypothetical protein